MSEVPEDVAPADLADGKLLPTLPPESSTCACSPHSGSSTCSPHVVVCTCSPRDTNEASQRGIRSLLCIKLEKLTVRKVLLILVVGQILSLLLCGTSVTSGLLSERNVTVPTAQSLANYCLLAVVYAPWLALRAPATTPLPPLSQNPSFLSVVAASVAPVSDEGLGVMLLHRGWKYALLALVDVEANFLMVKAYHYTSVTSVQLLDCFTIPVVLLLSTLILKVKYKIVHFVGVFVCLLGVAGLIGADVMTSRNEGGSYHSVAGDMMVLAGSVLYAVSNVAEEFVVKKFDMVEFLAMIGTFGSVISGIQLAVLERDELANMEYGYETVLLLIGFALCLFTYYSTMPIMMRLTSAAVVNLSILSADFYALMVGLWLFKYSFHGLYFVAFVVIIVGVVVFCTKEVPHKLPANEAAANQRTLLSAEAPPGDSLKDVVATPQGKSTNESTPLRSS